MMVNFVVLLSFYLLCQCKSSEIQHDINYVYKHTLLMKVLKPPVRLDTTPSTNAYANMLIKKNKALNGMLITAVAQTAGKGQDKNFWESKPNENLTISIIVKPYNLMPARQFILNKITSLAIRDFVMMHLKDVAVSIKWPNDVYADDQKIAGILISNTIEGQEITWSVIGIGVNINQTKFESPAPNPVSLKLLSGANYVLDD
ncbi:MAG TPA: biotin--[acetyl-CoA-carboxylase] ligase, partial [Bacteroidales bacterium]|nr:biotin--[acetyl-CoA-carboxylase] ligase [Bacteroidales bacterium]